MTDAELSAIIADWKEIEAEHVENGLTPSAARQAVEDTARLVLEMSKE